MKARAHKENQGILESRNKSKLGTDRKKQACDDTCLCNISNATGAPQSWHSKRIQLFDNWNYRY